MTEGIVVERVKSWPFPDKVDGENTGEYLTRLYIALQEESTARLEDFASLYALVMEQVLESYVFEEDGNADLQPVLPNFANDPYWEINASEITPKTPGPTELDGNTDIMPSA